MLKKGQLMKVKEAGEAIKVMQYNMTFKNGRVEKERAEESLNA